MAAPKINPDSPLNAGLLAWYLAHPAYFGGTVWPDLSGNGHDGSFVGLTVDDWSEDRVGGAKGSLEYVGTVTPLWVSVGSVVSSASPVSDLTFVAWVNRQSDNPLALNGREGIIFSRGGTVAGLNFQYNQLRYHLNGDFNHHGYSTNLNVPYGVDLMCALVISTGVVYLAAFGPDGLIRDHTREVATGTTYLDDVFLGADTIGDRYIQGRLSDARIYNRALSPTEIAAYYAESLGGYKTVLKRSGPILSSPHLANHLGPSQLLSSPHLLGSFP